jgi:hypothetical protein
MSLLSFLKSSHVEEALPGKQAGTPGVKKQRNPAAAIVAIRLFKDGSIYPSQAARDKFDLEYKKAVITKEKIKLKEGETEEQQKYRNTYDFPTGTGNGLDLIDSRIWNSFKAAEGMAMLFTAVVPKSAGKVDMFGSVSYDEEGTPKTTVMEQGAATFGENILKPAVEQVYGIKFNSEKVTDGVDFVDLAIVESLSEGEETFDITGTYSKPIIFVPKVVTRGDNKGQPDYAKRENVKVYGLVPAAMAITGYDATKVDEQPAAGNSAEVADDTQA